MTEAPSHSRQIRTVAGYEILKYLRGRRLPGMLVLLALIVGLILGLPPALGMQYASEPNAFASGYAQFASLLVVLCGVLFAADALCGEHEKRTAYFLFPNPVRREAIVAGKLAASLATSGAVLTLYYVAAMGSTLAITGSMTIDIVLSYGYTLAYMTAVVGVAFLISSVLKGAISSTVFTFFLFILIFQVVQAAVSLAEVDPWFLPNVAAGIIANAVSPTSIPGGPGGPGGPGFLVYVPEVSTALAIMLAYALLATVASVLLFRTRELVS